MQNTYPTNFSTPTNLSNHDDESNDSLQALNAQGYEVIVGMLPADLVDIQAIANQPSVKAFCPNDHSLKRFRDEVSTKHWLSRGRLVFLLRDTTQNNTLVGYGWVGPAMTPRIPEGNTTVAIRLNEQYQGKGLAAPFLGTIIAHTLQRFPDTKLWLEAWKSNEAGIHTYKKLGFTVAKSVTDIRRNTPDERVYMSLAQQTLKK